MLPGWAGAPSFDIRYDDTALRNSYPGVGPWRSGQYQPSVNGGTASVLDPADATVKYFHKGNLLYLGFDVRDQVVQFHPNFDSWDGFMVGINSLDRDNPDHVLSTHRLSFRVSANGTAQAPIEMSRSRLGSSPLVSVSTQTKRSVSREAPGEG